MPAISLQHLMPTSLLGFPATYSPDLAEAAARIVYERRDEFDVILITGDLATTSHVEYLKAAHSYITGKASAGYLTSSGDPTLQGGNARILLLPGNHDRYRDIFGSSAGPHFEIVFESEWWTPPVSKRVIEKDGENLAIIAADFCLHQDADAEAIVFVNRLGRGRVYDDVLAALERETQETRSKYGEIAIIWAVHFPPSESCSSALRLVRSTLLEDAAERNSVQMFVAGHLHRNVEHRTRHATPILCAGTLTSSGGDHFNWLHFLEIGVSKKRITSCEKVDYRWDDEEGDFVGSPLRQVSLDALV